MKMSEPFAYLNAINTTKVDLMTGSEDDEQEEKEYVPFVVNRSLSYFPDTVLYANEMNLLPNLDKKLQFHYLINSIRPRKRYSKWVKKLEDNDLSAVMEYYECNARKAETALRLLSPDQIEQIKLRLLKGGST
jgi:hypothetical protein